MFIYPVRPFDDPPRHPRPPVIVDRLPRTDPPVTDAEDEAFARWESEGGATCAA